MRQRGFKIGIIKARLTVEEPGLRFHLGISEETGGNGGGSRETMNSIFVSFRKLDLFTGEATTSAVQ